MEDYNPSYIFARARLVLTYHVTEYSPAKTEEYPSNNSQFSKLRLLRKIFEAGIINTTASMISSVPQSSQFSSNFAPGKQFASRNRYVGSADKHLRIFSAIFSLGCLWPSIPSRKRRACVPIITYIAQVTVKTIYNTLFS